MKLKLVTLLLILCSNRTFSQVAISYFPFQSILAVSSNTEKLFWVDYKLETNSFVSNLNMEFSPKINLKRTEYVNYYIGPGISFNLANAFSGLSVMNGSFIDFGARIKPLKNKNFQLVFEISPYANRELSGGNLRTRLGLAWNFSRKK